MTIFAGEAILREHPTDLPRNSDKWWWMRRADSALMMMNVCGMTMLSLQTKCLD